MASIKDRFLFPKLRKLTSQFEQLGAPNAESWAKSQLREGFDQISRATMLRFFADKTVENGKVPQYFRDAESVTAHVKNAVDQIDKAGLTDEVEIVLKLALFNAMSDVMVVLDGNAAIENNPEDIEIGLYKLDSEFSPETQIVALHESWSEFAAEFLGKDVIKHY